MGLLPAPLSYLWLVHGVRIYFFAGSIFFLQNRADSQLHSIHDFIIDM